MMALIKISAKHPPTEKVQAKTEKVQKIATDVVQKPVTRRPRFFRLSLDERMLLVKRLGILLKAGVPIVEALNMIKKQSESKSGRFVLGELAQGVENGQFLHVVLDKYRTIFGDFTVNMIRVGEVSGTLHDNLTYLAAELKKQKDLRRKVVSALVYPIFIVIATIGITVLLTVYVFPKILPIFQSFTTDLPLSTRMLIFISHLFATWGWLIALIIVGLIFLFTYLVRKNLWFALTVDKVLLKIPVLGKMFQSYHVANFTRTMSVLLRSDVRIVEATNITAKTTTNLVYKNSLEKLAEIMINGGKISQFLELEGKLYPAMVSQMVAVGEKTGNLSESLMYLAEIYESEVDELTKNLSTAIEPILMIFMGILVGFVAISIITPIYSFTQHLNPYGK
jgi:type IV pilus assembly protein PilC